LTCWGKPVHICQAVFLEEPRNQKKKSLKLSQSQMSLRSCESGGGPSSNDASDSMIRAGHTLTQIIIESDVQGTIRNPFHFPDVSHESGRCRGCHWPGSAAFQFKLPVELPQTLQRSATALQAKLYSELLSSAVRRRAVAGNLQPAAVQHAARQT
jgi:hypothetical protein